VAAPPRCGLQRRTLRDRLEPRVLLSRVRRGLALTTLFVAVTCAPLAHAGADGISDPGTGTETTSTTLAPTTDPTTDPAADPSTTTTTTDPSTTSTPLAPADPDPGTPTSSSSS